MDTCVVVHKVSRSLWVSVTFPRAHLHTLSPPTTTAQNLGHHRLPSNKFLLYDHSMRIPMLFKGPGIAQNTESDFLGTQVDLAPTILGFAGIATPSYVDGKSLVSLLVSGGNHDELLGATRNHLRTELLNAPMMSRDASFLEYYNQGPWEVGSTHALDDWSNTYIGLYVRSKTFGNWKYGEFDPYGKQSNFTSVYMTELFNLDADPWEKYNVINASNTSAALKEYLHTTVRAYYECVGVNCM